MKKQKQQASAMQVLNESNACVFELTANVDEIKANPNNPRFIKDAKFAQLVQSIKDFPEMLSLRPIVVDENMEVLGGNMRLKAIQAVGLQSVPIIKVEGLTQEQKNEFVIKDNLGYGEWDWDVLANEWDTTALENWGLELPTFNVGDEEATDDGYEIPDEIQTEIVSGDVIEIAQHRLMCGDSTNPEHIATLLQGATVDIVFSDPPYGNGKSGAYGRSQLGHRTIAGDKNFETVESFINLNVCKRYMLFLQWRTFAEALATLQKNNLQLKTIAVWDKKNAGLGSGMAEAWEAILVAGDIKYTKFGGNVFSISREVKQRKDSPHPHQKPVELLSQLLSFVTNYNVLLDPFLGSGSTMLTAHQLQRTCYGMEIEPTYCQVVVDRMLQYDASLPVTINGKPYKQKQATGEQQ